MRRILGGLIVGVIAAAFGSAALPVAASQNSPTIVGIAAGNPDFSTLVAAVSCTGLVPVLNGEGNYTVFAPTNEAFAALDLNASNVCSLPKSTLTSILLYHVTDGKRFAKSVLPKPGHNAKTIETLLAGQTFQVDSNGTIRTSSGGTSQIVAANIAASNGVIHVINAVLLPAS